MLIDKLDVREEYCRTADGDYSVYLSVYHYKAKYVHWLEDRYIELKNAAEERGAPTVQQATAALRSQGQ